MPLDSIAKNINLSDELIKNSFINNDTATIGDAIAALQKKPAKEFETYIGFLFREALDTQFERARLRGLSNKFNAKHIPTLTPYLYSTNIHQQYISAYFLISIGNASYPTLKRWLDEVKPQKNNIIKIMSALQLQKALSRDKALNLFYALSKYTKANDISSLNFIRTYEDFSQKGRTIFLSCLNSEDGFTSFFTADLIAHIQHKIDSDDKKVYIAAIYARLRKEKEKNTPKVKNIRIYNLALFSLGEINKKTINSMLNMLKEGVDNDIRVTKLPAVFMRVGVRGEVLIQSMFKKIVTEKNEHIRKKYLKYLHETIKPITPFDAYISQLHTRAAEDQQIILEMVVPYKKNLEKISNKKGTGKVYADKILSYLPK